MKILSIVCLWLLNLTSYNFTNVHHVTITPLPWLSSGFTAGVRSPNKRLPSYPALLLLFLRMRSALLSLLFILALSDGADHQNNDRYAEFKRKHILPAGFQTDSETAWVKHLEDNTLCERTPVQSFIDDTIDKVTQICNGTGQKIEKNYYKSTELFQLYMIKSKNTTKETLDWKCIIEKCRTARYYVIVECEEKLPVHYDNQRIEKGKKEYPCYY